MSVRSYSSVASSLRSEIMSEVTEYRAGARQAGYYETGSLKLPTVSGHERLIRPIAFKPILTPHPHSRYVSTPRQSSPISYPHMSPRQQHNTSYDQAVPQTHFARPANSSHHDDGYLSQEYNSVSTHSHTNSSVSQNSASVEQNVAAAPCSPPGYVNCVPTNSGYTNTVTPKSKVDTSRCETYSNSSNYSRASSQGHAATETFLTPSPSDSGVGEIEAMLRDKDTEIANLRETMEKNESAILQVYEEKRMGWQMEMRELNMQWDQRLKQQQQKAFKTEQALLMQLFKLQQERKTLRLNCEQLRSDKEKAETKVSETSSELSATKSKVEELEWTLQQKTGEISLLKTQLKDSKDETTSKSTDLIGLKSQIKNLIQERDSKTQDIQRLREEVQSTKQTLCAMQSKLDTVRTSQNKDSSDADRVSPPHATNATNTASDSLIKQTEERLRNFQEELKKCQAEFQREREQWLEEKNKVIRYQKHLQLNYVQMMRRNKVLEAEVEQLTLELENRDIKLMDAGKLDTEESVC